MEIDKASGLDYRYVSSERYTEALDLLQSGACFQLAQGQVMHFFIDKNTIFVPLV